jgi:uncharacterized membrane protein
MRLFAFGACAALLSIAVGCSQESAPGGPGVNRMAPATQPSTTTTAQKPVVVDKHDTFTLLVPKSETLNRGKKEEVTISISRGTQFAQNVRLEIRAPQGLSVTPAEPTIPSGSDKVKVTIEANKDAPVGKSNIAVTATPQTGEAVSMQIPVEVKAS